MFESLGRILGVEKEIRRMKPELISVVEGEKVDGPGSIKERQ